MADFGGAGEPPNKKSKIERTLFKRVRTVVNSHKKVLSNAFKKLSTDQWVTFCFVKILNCNGAYPCSFSRAWCETIRNIQDPTVDEGERFIVKFPSLFNIALVEQFLEFSDETDDSAFTDNQLTALQRLAVFLDKLHETNTIMEKQPIKSLKESAWAAILGTHVLSKLAVSNQMTIDCGYTDKTTTCPCGCMTPIYVGDNSMGHEAVWHGSVDILLGPVAVVAACSKTLSEIDEEGISAFEMKIGEIEESRNQVIAETIVFSFTQKSGLVPTICVTKDNMKILMYDPEFDLLYESSEIQLFEPLEGLKFNLTTIVALWLAINYSHFCTGVKPSHEKFGYTADFKRLVEKAFPIYNEGMKMGGCKHVKNPIGKYKAPENIGKFPSLDD